MSKKRSGKSIPLTEEEIQGSFEEALKNGEVTDIMGNKIEEKDLIEWEDGQEKEISFNQSVKVLRGTEGKVLTIVDATLLDAVSEAKLKYIKDLVKDAFSSQADWLFELTHPDNRIIQKKSK